MKPTRWFITEDRERAFSINSMGDFVCYDRRLRDPLGVVSSQSVPEDIRSQLNNLFSKINSLPAEWTKEDIAKTIAKKLEVL